jgi:hypothetical protein
MGINTFPPKVMPVPYLFAGTATGTGATITVGNSIISATNLTGSGIDSGLADAATGGGSINAPGAWTTIAEITGGPLMFNMIYSTQAYGYTYIYVHSSEGSGDSLRLQVLIDGTIVWDAKVVADGIGNHLAYWYPMKSEAYNTIPIYCASSLLIRGTRIGNFTSTSSIFRVGHIYYNHVRLGS